MKKTPYVNLVCDNCGGSWWITFSNTSAPPSEYAMAIEQRANRPCPDCGKESFRAVLPKGENQ